MDRIERELPIFPLNVVLFPTMVLPLRIFEERYKAMLHDCLAADSRFGVALIKEGREVGGPAVPYDVGTMARISRVTPLESENFNILMLGERRFRLLGITQRDPYLKGPVRLIAEEVGEPPPGAEEEASIRQMLEQYLRVLLGLRGGWVREVPSPSDPVELSFLMGAVLRGDNLMRQRILEASTARERLAMLTPLLRQAYHRTRATLEERLSLQGPRLN